MENENEKNVVEINVNKKFSFFNLVLISLITLIIAGTFGGLFGRATAPQRRNYAQSMETIVTGVRETSELITKVIYTEHTIVISQRGGLFNLGTIEQELVFAGEALVTTDLSNFSDIDLIIDSSRRRVWVSALRPTLRTIFIDTEESYVGDPTTSLLAWGNVYLTPEEYQYLLLRAENEIELLILQQYMVQAYDYTERAIIQLIQTFLTSAGLEDYEIYVLWK